MSAEAHLATQMARSKSIDIITHRILAHSWEVMLLNNSFGLGSQSEEGLEAIIDFFYKISKISQFLTNIDKVWTQNKGL